MKTTTTTLEIGQSLVINGEVRTIIFIKGRWVRISDDSSISRAAANAGRIEFLQDAATLGDELANPEDQDTAIPAVILPDPRDVAANAAMVETLANPAPVVGRATSLPEAIAASMDTTPEDAQIEVVTGYVGPMLALRQRLQQGAYSKAANGQPCCGDEIAQALGSLKPAQVIRACIIAMALPANPYTHLNIGQQSMNLRNKLRGCMKRGEFGMGVVVEAVEEVTEEAMVEAAKNQA